MKKEGQETNKLHTNLLVSRSSTEKDFSRSLFLRKKKKKKQEKKKEKDVKINTNVMSYSERAFGTLSLLRGQYMKKILNGKMYHYVFCAGIFLPHVYFNICSSSRLFTLCSKRKRDALGLVIKIEFINSFPNPN